MKSPYQLLLESGFFQYTAMIRVRYDRENTSLGAEKVAEMIRAIPGATRVSTVSLDKEHGIGIFNAKIISQKSAKEAYQALKKNALARYAGLITGVDIGVNTIETKGDFIIKEQSNLSKCIGQMLEEGLLLEVSIEDLRKQYVDSQKLPEDLFDAICQAAENKSNYATWLCKKIADKVINPDSLEEWHDRFVFFDTNKQRFKTKDLNTLKTAEQIQSWLTDEYIPVEKDVFRKQMAGGSRIDDNLHERLLSLRTKDCRGPLSGKEYYVFKLGAKDFDVEHYLGSGTTWCTRDSKNQYDYYMSFSDPAGCDPIYWVFVNKNNPGGDKWQCLLKANYLCDINDRNLLTTSKIVPLEILEYLKNQQGQAVENCGHNRGGDVTRNLQWFEEKLKNSKHDSSESSINLDEYLFRTESSYKLYNVPSDEELRKSLLISLGVAKSKTHAEVILEEFAKDPIAIVVNEASKKNPIYIALNSRGQLGDLSKVDWAGNPSIDFPSVKNENEYKLLRAFANEMHKNLSPLFVAAWDTDEPDLKEFKFNGREDIWKFPARSSNLSKALVQLATKAVRVTTGNQDTEWFYNQITQRMGSIREDAYFMLNGHFLGVFLPPRQGTYSTDTEYINLNATTDSTSLIPVYLKASKAEVPMHLEPDSEQPSILASAKFRVEHPTLESLDEFKVTSANSPRANKYWDFYKNAKLSRAVSGGYADCVIIQDKKSKDFVLAQRGGYLIPCKFEENQGIIIDPQGERKLYLVINQLGIYPRRSASGEENRKKVKALMNALGEFGISTYRNEGWRRVCRQVGVNYYDTTESTEIATVSDYLEEHENELHSVTVPYSRRSTISSNRGLQLSWADARNILNIRSPRLVENVEEVVANDSVKDVTFYVADDVDVSNWLSIIRVVNDQNQITKVCVKNRPGNQGEHWRWIEIPERARITLDDQGNVVQTAPVRAPRQPRQPRQLQPAANQEAPANLEELNEYSVDCQNSHEAYQVPAEHAREALQAAGFVNLAGSIPEDKEVLIYRTVRHKGPADYVALVSDGETTVVAGRVYNATYHVAASDSMQWRALTREIDNSVPTFQQCHDVCQELHIPLPLAIVRWIDFRHATGR